MDHHTDSFEITSTPLAAKVIFILYRIGTLGACLASVVMMETWVFPPLLVMMAVGVYAYHFTYPCHRLKSMIAFLIVDAVILGILLLLRWLFPVYFAALSSKFLVGIVLQIFTITGMMFILVPINSRIKRKRRCTVSVRGVVREYNRFHERSGPLYSPIYVYSYKGVLYHGFQDIHIREMKPKVGEERDIYINPENPAEMYEKKHAVESCVMKFMIGIGFGLGGLLSTVMLGIT